MNPQKTTLTIRDLPILAWIVGTAFLILSVPNLVSAANAARMAAFVLYAILALAGLGILLRSSLLTITADRDSQTLTLRQRSLLNSSLQEIPFAQIEAIQMEVQPGRWHASSRSGPSYRIVLIQKGGQVLPFRHSYSSGTAAKTRQIKQLREFIGVGGSEMGMSLLGTLREASKMARNELQQQQEALTGNQEQVRVTDGVHWQVQTVAFGGSPVTRWFSPDYQVADGFVYITQMAEGQKMSAGGLLANLGGMLFRQSLRIYGFGGEEIPGVAQASVLSQPDPCLAAFSVYSGTPASVQKVLNPRVAAALADWNRRFPLKQIHSETVFSQLVVMFSPKGVYVASMGTMIPEAVEEMTRLGVVLVKTQLLGMEKDLASNP